MSWLFYEAQRSGHTPSWNSVPWRRDSHLSDTVIGGWYDAGDYLKLAFPLAPTVGMLAHGLIEFEAAYSSAGKLKLARNNLRHAADFLHRCYDPISKTYAAQIGDPGKLKAYTTRKIRPDFASYITVRNCVPNLLPGLS